MRSDVATHFEVRLTPLRSALERQRVERGHLGRTDVHAVALGVASDDGAENEFFGRGDVLGAGT